MARQMQSTPPPDASMPVTRALLFMGLAALFDALKAFFVLFLVTLPLSAGYIAQAAAGGGWVGWAAGWATTIGIGGAEAVVPFAGGAVESLGIIMAMLIGFIGWLLFAVLFFLAGIPFWNRGGRNFLRMISGWF